MRPDRPLPIADQNSQVRPDQGVSGDERPRGESGGLAACAEPLVLIDEELIEQDYLESESPEPPAKL